jgi:hypothetical protein
VRVTIERNLYSDANGIRIGTVTAVFGDYSYPVRDISFVSRVLQRGIIWPGVAVLIVSTILLIVGAFTNPNLMVVGAAGAFSGSWNLQRKRKKTLFGVRLLTPSGGAYVFASRDSQYVDRVVEAVKHAMSDSDGA